MSIWKNKKQYSRSKDKAEKWMKLKCYLTYFIMKYDIFQTKNEKAALQWLQTK